jgi:glycosyltransferase involved in cell wall biosynthesis
MLLSIIIPSFQMGHEIGGALQSIQKQDFIDYEVLIIDGCSSDNTIDIVKEYKGLPVTFVQEIDSGVYDAMNKGINLSKGEWLYFMGSDDKLCDGILKNLEDKFVDKSDIIYGNVVMRSNNSIYAGEFDLERLLFQCNICHQAIFYRRSVFEKIGLYNLKYKIWSDWDLNIRAFKHPGITCKYINANVSLYNDEYGVSDSPDLILSKELPVVYINKINYLETEIHKLNLLNNSIIYSNEFIIGARVTKFLNMIGLGRLFK